MKTIGEKISIARGNQNLTRSELAAILNISSQKVVDWEENLDIPNAVIIKRLSEILNVPVNYFFDDTIFLESGLKDTEAKYTEVEKANSNNTSDYFKKRDMNYEEEEYSEEDRKRNIRISLISFLVCIVNSLIASVIVLVVNRITETLLFTLLGGLLPIAATQLNLLYLRNSECSDFSCYKREYEEARAGIGVVIFIIMSLVLPWVGVGVAFSG